MVLAMMMLWCHETRYEATFNVVKLAMELLVVMKFIWSTRVSAISIFLMLLLSCLQVLGSRWSLCTRVRFLLHTAIALVLVVLPAHYLWLLWHA